MRVKVFATRHLPLQWKSAGKVVSTYRMAINIILGTRIITGAGECASLFGVRVLEYLPENTQDKKKD
jgi:hypothetical protein